jgi:hypothetical protein
MSKHVDGGDIDRVTAVQRVQPIARDAAVVAGRVDNTRQAKLGFSSIVVVEMTADARVIRRGRQGILVDCLAG